MPGAHIRSLQEVEYVTDRAFARYVLIAGRDVLQKARCKAIVGSNESVSQEKQA